MQKKLQNSTLRISSCSFGIVKDNSNHPHDLVRCIVPSLPPHCSLLDGCHFALCALPPLPSLMRIFRVQLCCPGGARLLCGILQKKKKKTVSHQEMQKEERIDMTSLLATNFSKVPAILSASKTGSQQLKVCKKAPSMNKRRTALTCHSNWICGHVLPPR